jgi:hypothetical protein
MIHITIEKTLNKMLDTEVDILYRTERNERFHDKVNTRISPYFAKNSQNCPKSEFFSS